MEIVAIGRGGGKTHRYLEKLIEDPSATLVVMSESRRSQVAKELCDLYEERIPDWNTDTRTQIRFMRLPDQVVRFHPNDTRRRLQGKVGPIAIDDLDLILWDMLGALPTSVSMSTPIRVVQSNNLDSIETIH